MLPSGNPWLAEKSLPDDGKPLMDLIIFCWGVHQPWLSEGNQLFHYKLRIIHGLSTWKTMALPLKTPRCPAFLWSWLTNGFIISSQVNPLLSISIIIYISIFIYIVYTPFWHYSDHGWGHFLLCRLCAKWSTRRHCSLLCGICEVVAQPLRAGPGRVE